jgi:FkbM family methyltransferase
MLCWPIVIQKRGFRMRFYPTNATAQQWVDPYHLRDKEHGYREETFFRHYLRQGDVVVDVGANVGITTLAAFSAVGPSGRVYAFEPHPRIYRFLVGNIELNDAQNVVTAQNLALGEHDGTAFLTDRRADDQNTVAADRGIAVPMSTLDAAVASVPSISLLKIDVEGYEKFVLLGAARTLERVECVYFESFDPNLAQHGYPVDEVVELLMARGFEVRRLDRDSTTTMPATSGERPYGPDAPEDLVAVRDVDRLERRLRGEPVAARG